MRAMARWSVSSPVAANVLMVLIFFGGAMSLLQMRREFFPEFVLDFIVISVPYPGASPEEIEEGICVKIEEQIEGLDGLKRLSSRARENVGTVIFEVETGVHLPDVYDDIKNEIDQIDTFPIEADEPIVSKYSIRDPAIQLAVYGDTNERALRGLAQRVRDDLVKQPGVSLAELVGARDYEISIEVSEEAMRRYGISFDTVARAVSGGSLDLPGGVLKTGDGDILVRAKGQRYRGREYEDIPLITLPDGAIIRLGQVATVVDGFEDEDRYARYAGQPAILIQVMKTRRQDIIEVVDTTLAFVEEQRLTLPEGIGLAAYYDRSILVQDRINLLTKNGAQGLALVFLTLWLFLRFRLAFWVALGIPISFMGGFILLGAQDATINMITLFAFIMTLGIVVDDAIIVGENIFAHYRAGASPTKAALDGASEVAWPVTNAVLTSIVAFMPMLFMTGVMGKFIAILPVAVIATLIVSLLEAFLILPAHLHHSLHKHPLPGSDGDWPVRRAIDRAVQWVIDDVHGPLLRLATRYRYITVAVAIMIVIVSFGLVKGGRLPFIVFPKVDIDYIKAKVVFPQGTPVSTTEKYIKDIEEGIQRVGGNLANRMPEGKPLVAHIASLVGEIPPEGAVPNELGGHVGQVFVELLPSEQRNISAFEVLNRWRAASGEPPGVELLTFTAEQTGPGGMPIEIRLLGDDLDDLEAAAEDLKNELGNFPGVFDIRDDFAAGKWEFKIRAKPEAKNLGLTLGAIAHQVRQGFYGDETLRLQRGRHDVKVMVRYPLDERRARSNLEQMRIRTPSGAEAPFNEVADVTFGRGYSTIRRVDRTRAITVTADLDEAVANANEIIGFLVNGAEQNAEATDDDAFLPGLTKRYPGVGFDLEGQARESRESIQSLMRGLVFALIAIYCLLAGQFRSYVQPVIVMCAIPVAVTGAFAGHMIMGLPITMVSLFGIVALTGVVVNDSLVLIDFINRRVGAGDDPRTAAIVSGKARFRAIMLTSITTVAGLAPLLIERSFQAQILIPMAVSLAFGLMAATVLTLVLTPSVYLVVADLQRLFDVETAAGFVAEEE